MNYLKTAQVLSDSLNLLQPPVAISFSEFPSIGISRHEGRVAAGCRFWQDGAHSAFVTSPDDHRMCAIGVYTHSLQPPDSQPTNLQDALQVFSDLGYVRPADLALIPVIPYTPKYVVYSPLAATTVTPDVVLLFVNASQTLIVSEATQQVENQSAPAMGRPACAVIPHVMNSGRAALSLGCCGARAYLDVLTDDVAVFALPGANLEAYVERIEILANANRMLSTFHHIRRRAVEAGQTPSVKESLAELAEV